MGWGGDEAALVVAIHVSRSFPHANVTEQLSGTRDRARACPPVKYQPFCWHWNLRWFCCCSTFFILSENFIFFIFSEPDKRHIVNHFEDLQGLTEDEGPQFNNLVVDKNTGRVYIGAVNKLYQLSPNLEPTVSLFWILPRQICGLIVVLLSSRFRGKLWRVCSPLMGVLPTLSLYPGLLGASSNNCFVSLNTLSLLLHLFVLFHKLNPSFCCGFRKVVVCNLL